MERILRDRIEFRLITAATAELGIARAEAERPDAILMDMNLPGLDGSQAMRRIRNTPSIADTPVVAVSAEAMPLDIKRALAAGFDAYLTKPIDVAKLLATLATVLPAVSRRSHARIQKH